MIQNIDTDRVFADYFKPFGKHIQAAAYYVSKKLKEGHICFSIDAYNHAIKEDLIEQNPFLQEGELLDSNKLIQKCVSNSIDEIQPFIIDGNRFYLQRYFFYETALLERIKSFISEESTDFENRKSVLINQKVFIQELFKSDAKETNWQLVAALTCILYNFSIVTGGPGTGKTTTVAKLLAVLYKLTPDLKVALCAPTGKAAARMNESLQKSKDSLAGLDDDIKSKYDTISAGTIHRLLGYIKGSPYFKHNDQNQLNYDVVIVDESSMVDVTLMSKLLDAIPATSKVIFLGDKEQLASVEAGSIFGDLCLSQEETINQFSQKKGALLNDIIPSLNQISVSNVLSIPNKNLLNEHIVELQHSYRFKDTEGIGKFSKQVISGHVSELAKLKNLKQTGECVIVHNEYKGEVLNREIYFYLE